MDETKRNKIQKHINGVKPRFDPVKSTLEACPSPSVPLISPLPPSPFVCSFCLHDLEDFNEAIRSSCDSRPLDGEFVGNLLGDDSASFAIRRNRDNTTSNDGRFDES